MFKHLFAKIELLWCVNIKMTLFMCIYTYVIYLLQDYDDLRHDV